MVTDPKKTLRPFHPFYGYRDGYIAGHSAAYLLGSRSGVGADEPPPPAADPNTPEGSYRTDFQFGWVDGYQDGRAIVGYMIREPDLPAPPPPAAEPVPPRYHSQQDRTEGRL